MSILLATAVTLGVLGLTSGAFWFLTKKTFLWYVFIVLLVAAFILLLIGFLVVVWTIALTGAPPLM